jgi:methionine synthase II (cobalamin-independent)
MSETNTRHRLEAGGLDDEEIEAILDELADQQMQDERDAGLDDVAL